MAQASKEAIDAARDTGGIVRFKDNCVSVTWTTKIPLEADQLIRDSGWLISPSSARKMAVVIYK